MSAKDTLNRVRLLNIKRATLKQKQKQLEIYGDYPADTDVVLKVERDIKKLKREIKQLSNEVN